MPPSHRFLLMGSGEFEPWSAEVELAALDGRPDPRVLILPTASAPEGDEVFERWARLGLEHYGRAGVAARVVPIKARADAEREDLARQLDDAAMVFFSGGNPKHLATVLDGTRFGNALVAALERGTVFAGCSAGAMVASQSRDQRTQRGAGSGWVFGLGLVPHVSFGAHWDKMRYVPGMRSFVASRVPKGSWFVGIDERTAIVGDGVTWRVFGRGTAWVRHDGGTRAYRAGETFTTRAEDPVAGGSSGYPYRP